MNRIQIMAWLLIGVILALSLFLEYIMIALILIALAIGAIKSLFKTPYMSYDAYQKYLKSDKWMKKREKIIKRDNYTCQHCGCPVAISTAHVHHLTYVRLGAEWDSDLITLCRTCHKLKHSKDH